MSDKEGNKKYQEKIYPLWNGAFHFVYMLGFEQLLIFEL